MNKSIAAVNTATLSSKNANAAVNAESAG